MAKNLSTNPRTVKITALSAQELLLRKHAFVALCATRAWRYRDGELTRHEAIDWLQEWAAKRGLIDACGQDTIQTVIAKAFVDLEP